MRADSYDVIPMHPNGLKKHVEHWKHRVNATYHLSFGYMTLDAHAVRERWKITVRPETAMKIALRFGVTILPK